MVPTPDALSFGVMTGGPDTDVARLESMPFDSLWVGGHVASRNPSPEAMVALAWLAARTERVRVGTAILLLPLYPPAIVAKQIADLDRATGGRVTLGVGVGGEYPDEFAACGVPLGERGPRTDETIPLLRELWSGEPVTHHGRAADFDAVRIHPSPAQGPRLPIAVAGRQPVAMRRAARLGDGWLHGGGDPADLPGLLARLARFRAEEGTEGRPFEVHVISADAYTLDGVRRLEDQGVTDLIVGFRWPYVTGPDPEPLDSKLTHLRRYADTIIAKTQ